MTTTEHDGPGEGILDDAPPEDAVPGEVTAPAPPRPGLSPSRAHDFEQCPLLFRLRVVDRLPEPPGEATARGTLVHAVLEHLFDLPAAERTLDAATAALPGRWDALRASDEGYATLFDDAALESAWLDSARALLATYFTLEDPTRLEPEARELRVSVDLDDGPQLRGIVDRLDVAPNGWVRVVDYKTGKAPREGYEGQALFQMRFYAFVVWRTRGVLPKLLQLNYLGSGTVLRHEPTEAEMRTIETRLRALWSRVLDTARTGRWEPRQSALCAWCSFRDLCPAFGGTPPPLAPDAVERATGVRPDEAAA